MSSSKLSPVLSSRLTYNVANSWAKVRVKANVCAALADNTSTGYKVGRVDQAETALGAEMRLAADKGKGKKASGKGGGDKIVKRFVSVERLLLRLLTDYSGNYTRCTPTGLLSTKNSSRMIKRVTASRSAKVAGKMRRTPSGFACWTVLRRNLTSARSPTTFAAPSWRPC